MDVNSDIDAFGIISLILYYPGSSINAQMFKLFLLLITYLFMFLRAQYGSTEDFDEWAKVIGDDSWSWKNISRCVDHKRTSWIDIGIDTKPRYFNKFERYQPHPEYPLVDATARGSAGPVRIGYFNTITDTSKAFIQSCISIGIPFVHDFHGTLSTMGVSRVGFPNVAIVFLNLLLSR